MKSSDIPLIQYHKQLITPSMVSENVGGIYSDHLPVLFEQSIVNTIHSKEKIPLKYISWNVFDIKNPCGFKGSSGNNVEIIFKNNDKRQNNIVSSIMMMLDKIKPDFFVLQEVDEEFFKKLNEALSNRGKKETSLYIAFDTKDSSTIIYNNSRLKLVKEPRALKGDIGSIPQAYYSYQFSISIPEQQPLFFSVANVQLQHQDNPSLTESFITDDLVNNTNDNDCIRIIVGDFNCRIFPISNKPQNITTGVTPSSFRRVKDKDLGLQGCDWTDGAFYLNQDNEIHQCEGHILDPITVTIIKSEVLSLENREVDNLQKNEIERFRMGICLDDIYLKTKIFPHDKNLYEYNNEINKGNEKLVMRVGSNANNHKSLCLCGSNFSLLKEIHSKLTNLKANVSYEHCGEYHVLSIPIEKFIFFPLVINEQLDKDYFSNLLLKLEKKSSINISQLFQKDILKEKMKYIKKLIKSSDQQVAPVLILAILKSENIELKNNLLENLGWNSVIDTNKLITVKELLNAFENISNAIKPGITDSSIFNSIVSKLNERVDSSIFSSKALKEDLTLLNHALKTDVSSVLINKEKK